MEGFDLAGGRAANPGEQVGERLFAADAVEQHLGRVGAESAVDILPLSVRSSLGAVAGQGLGEDPAHVVGPLRSPAATQNPEWSSVNEGHIGPMS